MDILADMGVSKLSAKVFLKVNYSFKYSTSYFTCFVKKYIFRKQNLLLHFAFDLSLLYCLLECN